MDNATTGAAPPDEKRTVCAECECDIDTAALEVITDWFDDFEPRYFCNDECESIFGHKALDAQMKGASE